MQISFYAPSFTISSQIEIPSPDGCPTGKGGLVAIRCQVEEKNLSYIY